MTDHCRNGFLQERQCFRFFVIIAISLHKFSHVLQISNKLFLVLWKTITNIRGWAVCKLVSFTSTFLNLTQCKSPHTHHLSKKPYTNFHEFQ